MKISNINSCNPPAQINHRGGIKSLNVINPVSHYLDRYFNRMAKASADRMEPLSPKLRSFIRYVGLNKAAAWDINPAESKEYILFLHGMSQNVSNYQRLYEAVTDKKKGVFALEYRGYGVNGKSKVSEDKLKKDVETAYEYLTRNKGIKPENITVAGHSLGGVLAADFASKHPEIRALIMISPITKVSYLGRKFMQNKNLGVGAPAKAMNLTEKIPLLARLLNLKFNSINKMKKVQIPAYIVHSKNDSVTSKEGTQSLIKTARRRGVLKGFKYYPTGGHKVDSQKIAYVSDIIDEIYSKK